MIRSLTAIENLNYIYNILMKCSTSISNILKALWNPFFRTYLQKRLFQFDAMNKYIVFDVSLTCFRLRDLKWEVCGHATAHTRKIGFNQKSFLVKVMQHIEFFISFLTFHRPHTKPKKHVQMWYAMRWGLNVFEKLMSYDSHSNVQYLEPLPLKMGDFQDV